VQHDERNVNLDACAWLLLARRRRLIVLRRERVLRRLRLLSVCGNNEKRGGKSGGEDRGREKTAEPVSDLARSSLFSSRR